MDLPLHPVIVHFPVALTFVALIAYPALALWIGNNPDRQKAWVVASVLSIILIAVSYAALFSGEQDAEAVSKIVGNDPIGEHAEAAEWFFYCSWIPFLFSLMGLKPWKGRKAGIWLTVLAQVLVTGLLIEAAHHGGELVYKHGAARAHYEQSTQKAGEVPDPSGQEGDPGHPNP